jgi:CHASE2 domain-containing sensor protein
MGTLIVVLLVAWLILSIVGFMLKGLLWLGLIGVVLFVGTAVIAVIRRKAHRRDSPPAP